MTGAMFISDDLVFVIIICTQPAKIMIITIIMIGTKSTGIIMTFFMIYKADGYGRRQHLNNPWVVSASLTKLFHGQFVILCKTFF